MIQWEYYHSHGRVAVSPLFWNCCVSYVIRSKDYYSCLFVSLSFREWMMMAQQTIIFIFDQRKKGACVLEFSKSDGSFRRSISCTELCRGLPAQTAEARTRQKRRRCGTCWCWPIHTVLIRLFMCIIALGEGRNYTMYTSCMPTRRALSRKQSYE